MRGYILFFTFWLCLTELSAQKEFFNWYFGDLAGITFNTPQMNPTVLTGNPVFQYEGSATISDQFGNLLFSTNGEYVFNYLGQRINEDKLKGHQSSTQSALIAKRPGPGKIYYIFTTDASEYVDPPNEGLNYSIVDMDGNEGRGVMIVTNVPLEPKMSEKLTSALHANKKDIWIITKGWKNNNIYSYLLTENGITDTVITSIGFNPTSDLHSVGQLKASLQGSKIALTYQDVNFFEIYKFDNKSGKASSPVRITTDNLWSLYGVEFSPSGKVLYIGNSRNSGNIYSLFQYDVTMHDSTSIKSSEKQLQRAVGHLGSLQLGPNGRIYAALADEHRLMEIRNPEILGNPGIAFVSLGDYKSQLGLPNAVPKGLSFEFRIDVCENDPFALDPLDALQDTSQYQFEYEWKGPGGFNSKSPKPLIEKATLADSGSYILTVKYTVNNEEIIVSLRNHIRVNKRTKFTLNGKTVLCKGQLTTIAADTAHPFFTYRWSTGSTNQHITVGNPGRYFLIIRNSRGCYDTAYIDITVLDKPDATILGPKAICGGKAAELKAKEISVDNQYFWSTGETTPAIWINQPGEYTLKVINKNGCADSTKYIVDKLEDLSVIIEGDSVICVPGHAVLKARSVTDISKYKHYFVWSTGDTSNTLIATKSDTYTVTLVVEDNCTADASRTLERSQAAEIKLDKDGKINICKGDTVIVNVVNPTSNYRYIWSDGFRGASRKLYDTSGRYVAYAVTTEGCVDSAVVELYVYEKPLIRLNFEGEVAICQNQALTLHVEPKMPDFKYLWSTGETTDSIVVNRTGLYYVTVTNARGCTGNALVSVVVSDKLPVRIAGQKIACEGDTLILTANANYPDNESNFNYSWSTGETTKSIKVTESMTVECTVSHKNGCEGSDKADIIFFEIPTVELNHKQLIEFCRGDSRLIEVISPNPKFNYRWQDGASGTSRTIEESGTYKIYVSNGNICFDSAEVNVLVHDKPNVTIHAEDTVFCKGSSLLISSDFDISLNYVWSTGERTSTITVSNEGLYWLAAWNSKGCTDTAYIRIYEFPSLEPKVSATKTMLCPNEETTITVIGDYFKYDWSTGKSTKSILVSQPGIYSVVVFDENGCSGFTEIEIIAVPESKPLTFKLLNQPEPCIGETVIFEIEIFNPNDYNADIIQLDFLGSQSFQLLNQGSIKIIEANKSITILVQYKPENADISIATIAISAESPCETYSQFTFNGSTFMKTSVKAPNVIFTAGIDTCISFEVAPECTLYEELRSGFRTTISFAAEYFLPQNVSIGNIIESRIQSGRRILTIEVPEYVITQNSGLLITVCGTIMLGADSVSSIIIEDFTWSDNKIINSSSNGTLINESCVGELRGIKGFTPTQMKVSPTPASERIDITIVSGAVGQFELVLISVDGYEEILHTWQNTGTNKFDFSFDIGKKPQGVYNILLKAPWSTHYEKIMVLR